MLLLPQVVLPSLITAATATTVPLMVGLVQGRAPLARILTAPLIAVPVTALAILVFSILLTTWTQSLHWPVALHWIGWLSILTDMLVGYVAGRALAHQTSDTKVTRGTVIDDGAPLQRAARRRLKRDPAQISLAGIPIPPLDETKHFKLIGTTGTGKSTAIREILAAVLARGDRVVIADPDAGYLNRFYDPKRGDVILNPFDPRASRWDLFAEIEHSYDIEQLARALIPDAPHSSDREWRAYARTFFSALTRQLHEAQTHDLAELWRLLSMAPIEELRSLLQGTPAQSFLEPSAERMFGSVRSVATSALAGLELLAHQDVAAPALSVKHWIRQRSGEGGAGKDYRALFIPYQATQIAALRSIISTWLRLAIFETMSLPTEDTGRMRGEGRKTFLARLRASGAQDVLDGQRCWFIVDELDALGAIDGLKDALARLRKFGGRCVLGFQSIAQVSGTYGDTEAQTIVENCGNTLILRCSASEGGGTARFAAGLIGDHDVLRPHVVRSRRPAEFRATVSTSVQLSTESAVLPSEIEQLPDLTGFAKFASSARWLRIRLN